YYRFLARATHADPTLRFDSTSDMAEQALGVLCEVLAAADRNPRPTPSANFTPERRTFGSDERPGGPAVAGALPLPLMDPTWPGACSARPGDWTRSRRSTRYRTVPASTSPRRWPPSGPAWTGPPARSPRPISSPRPTGWKGCGWTPSGGPRWPSSCSRRRWTG